MADVERARSGQADVVVDADQLKKYDEIINLLIAAGYFRARISSLSAFDKIIGGLSWCITSSNVDVDIDVFFQENAQIGKKIELGEKIEDALVRMKCPFQLQSNQIRGLDSGKIFPVIQWLVQIVLKTREETGDLLRVFSESQFNKRNQLPDDKSLSDSADTALSFLQDLSTRYQPKRKYKRPSTSNLDEESRVESVLLEYGYLQWASRTTLEEDVDQASGSAGFNEARGKLANTLEPSKQQKQEEERKRKQDEISKVMQQMVSTGEGNTVGREAVSGLLDADIIKGLVSEFGTSSEVQLDPVRMKKAYDAEVHRRQKSAREEKLAKENQRKAEIVEKYNEFTRTVEALQTEYNKKLAMNKKIEAAIEGLKDLETDENKEILALLKSLVQLDENFKSQEEAFRATCKAQREELQNQIKKLTGAGLDDEELGRLRDIESSYQDALTQLNEARSLAAKKAREIGLVERQIDEVPSRNELQQYQKQFIELYEQSQTKFSETQKYYNTYNTLCGTREFVQKEVNILNSIDSQYKVAMKSEKNRETLRDSLVKITAGVDDSLNKIEAKLAKKKVKRDTLNAKYLKGLEEEREYYAMTKEFADQCVRNEKLMAALGQ
eukprot:TRINITY_DN3969_c0_g1_i1.p1 TRINITY_DN3969_c0_g1~~TRINITY_DN3969_c0_g1_i1.p1  ORF type:complete len:611 (-),score=171.21 TRINITY_DN3969_c0_g1_i1:64-1896(-)